MSGRARFSHNPRLVAQDPGGSAYKDPMEAIARVGARTTPLDPRFGLHGPGGMPGRAPATRMLTPTVVRRTVQRANIAPGAGIAAFTEAIAGFEAEGVAIAEGGGAAGVGEATGPDPADVARNHPTILPDGTILPAGMTMGHRAMRVRYLKRRLKTMTATRAKLLSKLELMGRWLVGLYMALGGLKDSLRIALLNRAGPGRIHFLTSKIQGLEAQIGKMERDMRDIRVEVGVLTVQIDDMTAELLTFGESI